MLGLLTLIIIGVPAAIYFYDKAVWQELTPNNAKIFTLTGHMDKGWVPGKVKAMEVASLVGNSPHLQQPIIKVSKGDLVSIKLTSSDVVHGFTLKEFGIVVDKGLPPGKVTIITFIADKEGTFTFSCNAICGLKHEEMKGTLIVTA